MGNVSVVKSDPPETKEILAEAIVRIGSAMNKLKASGLNEDAIIILVHAKSNVNKGEIKAVFDALRRLEGWYCRK